jgi:hypothetical protein
MYVYLGFRSGGNGLTFRGNFTGNVHIGTHVGTNLVKLGDMGVFLGNDHILRVCVSQRKRVETTLGKRTCYSNVSMSKAQVNLILIKIVSTRMCAILSTYRLLTGLGAS